MIPTPLPHIARFEHLAYGLFLHWGLYSQLGRGEWVQHVDKIPFDEYKRLQDTFTAADFDARAIAKLAKEAGMKYITLTTRHHEGFSLYDTHGLSTFDAPHSPAGRDLIAEFVEACNAEGIVPFFYHTTLDWGWESHTCDDAKFDEYLDYLHASVEVLCKHYGPIGGLWFDGNWSRRGADWKEDRLYSLIRSYQPEAMIINNTGLSGLGELGHPELDSVTFEQGLPKTPNREGWPKYVAGEMCQTMNAHWGIGARDFDYMSPKEIIQNLCACRKVGANYLLNVGPTTTGAIPEYEAAALRRVGQWVAQNATPIYNGKPVATKCQGRDFLLEAEGDLYYFVHDLAISGSEHVINASGGTGPRAIGGLKKTIENAHWVDSDEKLNFVQDTETGLFTVDCTRYPYGTNMVVRTARLSPSIT